MSIVEELLAEIEADPADEGSQLVIADYLQAAGDPRGDLIVLDHAERRGLLDDLAALDQLLLLAAEYSFPRATPDDPVLPFVCRRREPTWYEVVHEGEIYTLDHEEYGRRPDYRLRIRAVGDPPDPDAHYHALEDLELDEPWPEAEARETLAIVSDAIRAKTPFERLRFPSGALPLPQHPGSPLRCYQLPIEFLKEHDLLRNRFGLAARDYHRWHAIWNRVRAKQRG